MGSLDRKRTRPETPPLSWQSCSAHSESKSEKARNRGPVEMAIVSPPSRTNQNVCLAQKCSRAAVVLVHVVFQIHFALVAKGAIEQGVLTCQNKRSQDMLVDVAFGI